MAKKVSPRRSLTRSLRCCGVCQEVGTCRTSSAVRTQTPGGLSVCIGEESRARRFWPVCPRTRSPALPRRGGSPFWTGPATALVVTLAYARPPRRGSRLAVRSRPPTGRAGAHPGDARFAEQPPPPASPPRPAAAPPPSAIPPGYPPPPGVRAARRTPRPQTRRHRTDPTTRGCGPAAQAGGTRCATPSGVLGILLLLMLVWLIGVPAYAWSQVERVDAAPPRQAAGQPARADLPAGRLGLA